MEQAEKCMACAIEALTVIDEHNLNDEELMAVFMGMILVTDDLLSDQHGMSKGAFIKAIKTGCKKEIEEAKSQLPRPKG